MSQPVSVYVSQVSNAGGDIEVTVVAEQNPFSQDSLVADECFVLDNGANGQIFVWKGGKTVLILDWSGYIS